MYICDDKPDKRRYQLTFAAAGHGPRGPHPGRPLGVRDREKRRAHVTGTGVFVRRERRARPGNVKKPKTHLL